ncbi:hypothetical protein CHS0354_007559 [Potamilus streckersoni]|uniref:All-trans-retinol 13,14-reductase n=1 Tax=Potamilus streckersoni TaxID=2493646 RepID=A0AAE0T3Q7_9BIVA|nr:hypothetical protein CHS0354_007559 [Potamilus streckersoni]
MALIHTQYLADNPILWVCLLVGILICLLSFIVGNPRQGPVIFSKNFVRPPQPLVTDHAARTKVLKQRFNATRVPENLDAVIIGSGIGALTTAVLLGREGKKVLVLEQHDQAGGCCHTFVEKGFEFDTGIHYVGEMGDGEDPRILIDQVTEGQVVWIPMDEAYDTVAVGSPSYIERYPMVAGKQNYFRKLLEMFPQEKAAIDKYTKFLEENKWVCIGTMALKLLPESLTKLLTRSGIHGLIFPRYNKQRLTSVTEFLNSISENIELKAVLSYALGDSGVPPSQMSILEYGLIINHYMGGAYYPLGGSSEIAFQMIPIIERYGGKVLVNCPISEILIDEAGRAVGVRVHKSSGDLNIYAKCVISNAGVHNTFKYLLAKKISAKSVYYPLVEEIGSSISYITTFVGLDGSTKELGLKAGNTWAAHSLELEKMLEEYFALKVEEAADLEVPYCFISFPSAKDPSWEYRYPGKSAALIIALCPYEWFSAWEKQRCKHRGEDYVDLKERIGRQMWIQCQQVFPQLAGKMEYIEVGTPITNRHYLGYPKGEMCGLDHRLNRFSPDIFSKIRAKTDIPGLYLTGQDVVTGGFVSSLYSGVFTASAILNKKLLINLHLASREIKLERRSKDNCLNTILPSRACQHQQGWDNRGNWHRTRGRHEGPLYNR